MKKIVLLDQQKLHYVDNASPPLPGDNDILLRVKYCGVCRTDAKMWISGQRDLKLSRILGHEFCGVDKHNHPYLVWPGMACQACQYCCSGYQNLCRNIQVMGFHRDGGMAEFVVVPKTSLIELPPDYPLHLATFAEPMACGINALQMILSTDCQSKQSKKVKTANNTMVIFGGGTCGLLLALVAKNAALVPTIVEDNPQKRAKLRQLTALSDINLVEKLSPTEKFYYAVNATASIDAFMAGIDALAPLGHCAFFSGLGETQQISATVLNHIHYRQLSLVGAYGCTRQQMLQALQIISANRSAITALIEEFITLAEVENILPTVYAGESLRYIIKFF